MNLNSVLIKPLITEKTMSDAGSGKYTFAVDLQSTKNEIKKTIEKQFGVNVVSTKTMILKGKSRHVGRKRQNINKKPWKKAMVQLAKEQKIDLFEVATRS